MSLDALPAGWQVWTEEHEGRVILAYRPDVFDSQQFPAPCLPTIFVSNGSRRKRPGASQVPTDTWHVSLLLEPEIEGPVRKFDSRADALDGAVTLAGEFADGEVDYRGLYQVPREDYFEKLDELVGREQE
jgi:hypothetical protein